MNLRLQRLVQFVPGLAVSAEEVAKALTLVGVAVDRIDRSSGEPVLETDITTNRPDLLSYRGVARELSAIYQLPVADPVRTVTETGEQTASVASVEIEEPALAPRYSARIVRGVTVAPSPEWLARELSAVGIRSINNVVDVTNVVLLELGHPLHAFDLARLAGPRIVVRRPRPGESLRTLDGIDRKLDPADLVIADAERPVALAGVMGGERSEVTAATTDILLESAFFDPMTVRRMAARHGLRTEASVRFERRADIDATIAALDRAATLILETAGGRALAGAIDCYPRPLARQRVRLRLKRLEQILGLLVPVVEVTRILTALGFECGQPIDGLLDVGVPAARHEVQREIDLIEEVGRQHGYDKVAATLPATPVAPKGRTLAQRRLRSVRDALNGCGWSEAVTLSMVDPDREWSPAGPIEPARIVNPLSDRTSILRTSVTAGLFESVAHNLRNGEDAADMFEIAHVFRRGPTPGAVDERAHLGLCSARRGATASDFDERPIKGALENISRLLRLPAPHASGTEFPARLHLGDREFGHLQRVPDAILQSHGLDPDVRAFAAEIDLAPILDADPHPPRYQSFSRFPSTSRDISAWVAGATYDNLVALIAAADEPLLEAISFVERYTDRKLGRHSLTLRLVYRHAERTLSADEVQAAHGRILARLAADPRAELRV